MKSIPLMRSLLLVVIIAAFATQHIAQQQPTDCRQDSCTRHDDAHDVLMGIGQLVTLRFPAEKLREVNLAIEHGAWGAFKTESLSDLPLQTSVGSYARR